MNQFDETLMTIKRDGYAFRFRDTGEFLMEAGDSLYPWVSGRAHKYTAVECVPVTATVVLVRRAEEDAK